jgi:hypothetical protein
MHPRCLNLKPRNARYQRDGGDLPCNVTLLEWIFQMHHLWLLRQIEGRSRWRHRLPLTLPSLENRSSCEQGGYYGRHIAGGLGDFGRPVVKWDYRLNETPLIASQKPGWGLPAPRLCAHPCGPLHGDHPTIPTAAVSPRKTPPENTDRKYKPISILAHHQYRHTTVKGNNGANTST